MKNGMNFARRVAGCSLFAVAAILSSAVMSPAAMSDEQLPINDYPTISRADYVYACMQVNGQTREVLEKCSCSIDQIAALIPYAEYEEAEVVMSISQKADQKGGLFMGPAMQTKVKNLKLAQVEAELRCF